MLMGSSRRGSVPIVQKGTALKGLCIKFFVVAVEAKRFARAAQASATFDANESAVAEFERFCALHGLASLLAEPQYRRGRVDRRRSIRARSTVR